MESNIAGAADSDVLYVLFSIDGSLYAIENKYVSDVISIENDLTHLPFSAPYVYGICNSYGRLITVLNTPYFFNLTSGLSRQAIVLAYPAMKGLLVEHVIGVEKSRNLHQMNNPPCMSNLINNYFCSDSSEEVIAEINIPGLVAAYHLQ